MTALVGGALRKRFAFAPLAAADLPRILSEVLTAEPPRRVRPELIEAWDQWLQRRLERVDADLVAPGREFFAQSVRRLEEEFSGRDLPPLEARFLTSLVVSRSNSAADEAGPGE
jgi:hypothetical protein